MKIVIADVGEYQVQSFERLFTLADLIFLKRTAGLDQDEVDAVMAGLGRKDVPQDQQLLAVGLLVWAARRRAGEALTVEQACDFPPVDVSFVSEPGDPVELDAADPTLALPGSGQGAARRPAPQDRKRKTSKTPSTAA